MGFAHDELTKQTRDLKEVSFRRGSRLVEG